MKAYGMEVLLLKRKKPFCSLVLTAFEASTTIFKRHCPVLRVETNLTLVQVEFGTKHVNVTVTFNEIMCCCCNHLCSHLESVEPLFFVSSFFHLKFSLIPPTFYLAQDFLGPAVASFSLFLSPAHPSLGEWECPLIPAMISIPGIIWRGMFCF